MQRFEYGRHETFAIRHGWLSKGLARLESAGFQINLDTADRLGLGSKMVKSLSYWLDTNFAHELFQRSGWRKRENPFIVPEYPGGQYRRASSSRRG